MKQERATLSALCRPVLNYVPATHPSLLIAFLQRRNYLWFVLEEREIKKLLKCSSVSSQTQEPWTQNLGAIQRGLVCFLSTFCKDTELVQTGADCLQWEVSLEVSLEGSLSATPGRYGASGPGGCHRGRWGLREQLLQAQEQKFKVWLEMNMRAVGRMASSGCQYGAKEKEEHGFSRQYSQRGLKERGGVDTGDAQHSQTPGKAPREAGVCSLSTLARARCTILLKAARTRGMKPS